MATKISGTFVLLTAGLGLGVAVAPASAASVTAYLEGYKGGQIEVQYGSDQVRGGAGALRWNLQGDPSNVLPQAVGSDFITFCIEASESVYLNHRYDFAVVSPELAPNDGWDEMGSGRAGLLGQWFGAFYQGGQWSDWTSRQAMAFQMGVWEIVAETAQVFDLTEGFLEIDNQHSARTLAQSWLDQSAWRQSGASSLSLLALSSPWQGAGCDYQDQIMVVPTPSAAAAGLTLLVGLGVSRRRKRA